MTMGLVHAARQIEAHGRGPDKSLAHISPDESAMLDYMQGGRSMNPATGLPEYSLFGKILKAVAKIGASTVGFMYGGPLGAAAASAAVSKLTGDSWKSALTTGAISGLTSGLGSYASGTRGLSNLATTTGKDIALKAAGTGALQAAGTPAVGTVGSAAAAGAGAPVLGASPGFYSGLQNAAPMASMAPSTISSLAPAVGSAFTPAVATGLSALGSNIMNAGYGALGAGLGAAIPNKPKPATPLSLPPAAPYDPNNVFSWMKRPSQTQQPFMPAPMPLYDPDRGYADGGEVAPAGMGLPPSAAMPQLMSAALTGYMNARGGGRINGPGDGKSDDIPAMLSNGEHVIDAATVSDLGNGDNDAGHKRIEEIKQKIRSSAGRKNPRKASPKQKGLGLLLKSARA
jgi:hypothetical protein